MKKMNKFRKHDKWEAENLFLFIFTCVLAAIAVLGIILLIVLGCMGLL